MNERKNRRQYSAFCILHFALIAFFILHSSFFIPTPAHALEVQILPTPGETCKDDTCRKSICPRRCTKQELYSGSITSGTARVVCNENEYLYSTCVSGKCVEPGGNPAASTIPCNYTLDELVLTGINLSKFFFGITGSLALLFIAYGGYQLLTSVGNPEHIQKARGTLTAAFVGLTIILAATIFVRFIAILLGVEITGKGELGKIPVCVQGNSCPEGTQRFAPVNDAGQPVPIPCESGQVYCVAE